jgi:hypothetical protein
MNKTVLRVISIALSDKYQKIMIKGESVEIIIEGEDRVQLISSRQHPNEISFFTKR